MDWLPKDDSKYYYIAGFVAVGIIVVVIIGLIISAIVGGGASSDPGGGCKSSNDSDNYKVATQQCAAGKGTVSLNTTSKKYECKCGTSTLASSCPYTYTDATGKSRTFTGVPYCAADGTVVCGCGGTPAKTILDGTASNNYAWCSDGGGDVKCKMLDGDKICSAPQGNTLLGTSYCACGSTTADGNVCGADGGVNGGTWTCAKTSSGLAYVDCMCGASGSFVNTSSSQCPSAPTSTELNSDMSSDKVNLSDWGCSSCACDASKSTWTCTKASAAAGPPQHGSSGSDTDDSDTDTDWIHGNSGLNTKPGEEGDSDTDSGLDIMNGGDSDTDSGIDIMNGGDSDTDSGIDIMNGGDSDTDTDDYNWFGGKT